MTQCTLLCNHMIYREGLASLSDSNLDSKIYETASIFNHFAFITFLQYLFPFYHHTFYNHFKQKGVVGRSALRKIYRILKQGGRDFAGPIYDILPKAPFFALNKISLQLQSGSCTFVVLLTDVKKATSLVNNTHTCKVRCEILYNWRQLCAIDSTSFIATCFSLYFIIS